ncbi:putative EPIDERMAL PATTERNING FACTOR-like protein [Helianthus annuus]|uniref:Epidermal patterning factor-like protein n=1 Tax=Helianthus annuus TaxID=4232 RepID=A0A251TEN0_HELAN|nr:protein EPIDERMAL PATTERNING FACTOR 2 [Helianthus annuus]KAF5784664.1 putative EPIDERMAL PATTERNING FACTOR-like protein [Helianthus annuus]KAJ0528451.1 putative EPIDERMAL PATTERNING FACTOR-like protein [Helianthus annuus]KAJ0695394.1 putative EPIDERMAL PATTERNING FACTOR-like protein [Helianthus annuus]KAJ0882099.1 putative EPIDERMAL PATTERNING FACTOR-like protein [Helianthus annuus]
MKNIYSNILLLVTIVFLVLNLGESLHPHHFTNNRGQGGLSRSQSQEHPKKGERVELGMDLYPTGSSIPDCSHACGPCSPCRRVMISFKCSMTESCPVVYRCTCRGRYYHVPSN